MPSPSPPPSTSRQRRIRSCSDTRGAVTIAHSDVVGRREPEHRPHRGEAGARPLVVEVGPERGDVLAPATRDEQAELAALGRLERAERPAQQGHGVDERRRPASPRSTRRRSPAARRRAPARCRCRRGTPRRIGRRRPPECPGVSARPTRCDTSSADHVPPSWSSRVARPRTRPCTRAPVGEARPAPRGSRGAGRRGRASRARPAARSAARSSLPRRRRRVAGTPDRARR